VNSDISVMPGQIVSWLSAQPQLQNLVFLTEYPAQKKAVPLREAIVAVGIETIRLRDSFADNGSGVLEKQEYCRRADIRVKLGIHVPYASGGARCHDIFCDILDCLTFATDLAITESGCTRVKADRDRDAFVLDAYADVAAEFCPAQSSGLQIQSFLNKELLCGSHITDTTQHFSGAEKERFSQPFAVGTYFGTDAATRTLSLDFSPRLVLVFARQYPPVLVNFAGQSSASYWGLAATDSNGTQGIELTAGGFRLLSGSAYALGGCQPKLNESGVSYCYIAYK